MANDAQEKTEDPTSKKLDEARKKGQIARSRELSTALVLIVSGLAFLLFGGMIASAIYGMTMRMFTLSRDETYDPSHMFIVGGEALMEVAWPVLIYMVVAMFAGIYGSIALGGFNFSWESAAPKANKINPK